MLFIRMWQLMQLDTHQSLLVHIKYQIQPIIQVVMPLGHGRLWDITFCLMAEFIAMLVIGIAVLLLELN